MAELKKLMAVEGTEFSLGLNDLNHQLIETLISAEIDKDFYPILHAKIPTWIKVRGTEFYGTVPSKEEENSSILCIIGKKRDWHSSKRRDWHNSEIKTVRYQFEIEILTLEEYNSRWIGFHIEDCKKPLDKFKEAHPEAFYKWLKELIQEDEKS